MGVPSWTVMLGDLRGAAPLSAELCAELVALRTEPEPGEPYGRRALHRDEEGEVMLAGWGRDAACAPHDHAGGEGVVHVLAGAFTETDWIWRDGILARGTSRRWEAGQSIPVVAGGIHSMVAEGAGTTLHLYRPAISGMRVFDPARRQTLSVRDDCGAWVPRDERLILARVDWQTT
ncbi:MAG TPA: cysteine dioxygenase family protein [Polyangia bacterium]|nr:cysteine dioxygenase family protein [Polyangia bacterium]